jgi:integrase
MARGRRANGAGSVYIKHGSYYGRWLTADGGHANRRLGPVRRPGTREGLTRTQAEKRLRELIATVQVTTDPERTVQTVGDALLGHLEANGASRSHLETVESHLRVHVVPFFKGKPVDRIGEDDVTRFVGRMRRAGLSPKTTRNVLSTLHSVFQLAIRRRWVHENPCRYVERPAAEPSGDIRFLTHEDLAALLESGVPDDGWGALEGPLYLMAAMTGLRQGELLGLRWRDLDLASHKVRVRRAYVRGEFKAPKSVRGVRGVPLAVELEVALLRLAETSPFTSEDDLVFAHPETGEPLDRSRVRKRFQVK